LLESHNGKYNFKLSLNPQGKLTGVYFANDVSASYSFEKVSILTPGEYRFVASVVDAEDNSVIYPAVTDDDLFTITSKNMFVPETFLKISSIEINTKPNATIFEDIVIDAIIKDQQGNPWSSECNIVVNANNTLYGESTQLSKNGTVRFNVFFKHTGTVMLTVLTCGSLTKSFTMTLLPYTQKIEVTSHIVGII
jgi:hypothetical protein